MLHDVRNIGERAAMLVQVLAQVFERLEVGVDAARLRVGDEDEAVGAR